MVAVEQAFRSAPLPHEHIAATLRAQFDASGVLGRIKPRQTVALAAGSRGIDAYDKVFAAAVGILKSIGAKPFIFPAMGSHGGATPEGQAEVLATQGITEQSMGCPIKSGMDVVELGRTPLGLPVYLDRHAAGADHIIVINRIKLHTNFRGRIESGLCKMLAIGAGKHAQAIAIHAYGVIGLRDHMPEVAAAVIERSPVLAGVALIEDGYHHLSRIEVVPAGHLVEREPELLKEAAGNMARLPVEDLDLLVVDELGKNISGTGIDTNITGRCRMLDIVGFGTPRIRCIVALDLTEQTHGNAIGVGMADLITKRLADKIDHRKTAINCITGLSPELAAVPIALPTDREAIRMALDYFCGHVPFEKVTVIRIENSLEIGRIHVSESLCGQLQARPNLRFTSEPAEMRFGADGRMA